MYVVKSTSEIPVPEPVITIRGIPIATRGDITTIAGKTKSKKTTFENAYTTSYFVPQIWGSLLEMNLPEDRDEILHIDTEQSTFYCYKFVKRIVEAGAQPEIVDNKFHMINARTLNSRDLRASIDRYIEDHQRIGVVNIDGSRDCVSSINSEEDAAEYVKWAMRLAEINDIAVINNIHQNPSGNNGSKLRGHLGTELMNKSEFVIEVSKEGMPEGVSEIRPMLSRGKPFEPIWIQFDADDNIIILEPQTNQQNERNPVYDFTANQLETLVNKIFEHESQFTQKPFVSRIKLLLDVDYENIDASKRQVVDEVIPFLLYRNLITKEAGTNRSFIYKKVSDSAENESPNE